ncbi:sugar ABC transporter ATP-binding protein [Nonomuraea sediminis]|uniref:sugar ABC transporter ATP-binding protein n=1 Tax=Nonomuraea sediminis TaxID=2835864 RepID=UPI001BDCAF2C|nr:sugar ABC transporter ATP-binding protein [Nonomuraea sediminis]
MIKAEGLVKRFPGVVALDGADLELRPGEIHALVGENGAGKSTLVRTLAGIHSPDAGSMTVDGRPYRPGGAADGLAAGIQVVHQELALLPYLTVAENLFLKRLPRRAGIVDRRRLRTDAAALLEQIGLDVSPDTHVERLGLAQMQLVEIAKGLSGEARVLIMDEPTASLTSREAGRLFGILRDLAARGVAILYISHHLEEILEIADQVTVMRNGRTIKTMSMAGVTAADLVRLMVGRDLEQEYPPKPSIPPGEDALRVTDLRVAGFDHPLSFSVRKGEVLGIAGLVGSGRTEAMRALFGADPVISGNITLYGKRLAIRHPRDAVRRGISLLTEDRKSQGLVLDLPIAANVTLAKLRGTLLNFASERNVAQDLGKRLRLKSAGVTQPVRTLSGGNQQKVVLAKWLHAGSDVLIVDEPTRGIDVGAKYEIHELLLELAKDGKALIVVSSDLPELMGVCDRILVFSRGEIAGSVDRADFDAERILTLAYSRYLKNGDE